MQKLDRTLRGGSAGKEAETIKRGKRGSRVSEKLVIDIFKPPAFEKARLDIEHLNTVMGKSLAYASSGRVALYHILKSLQVSDKVLVPAYICDSILLPINKLGIIPIFYDLEEMDLNASLESIDFLSGKFNVKHLLVASMYGNPANLAGIEKFCREKGIALIDDAAQSFGARLGDRPVGTFGDAGFFSFSPGKPTAGHMGAFFWTSNEAYNFTRTTHALAHRIIYLDFYFNRLNIYKYRGFRRVNLFPFTRRVLNKLVDLTNDDISPFETEVLGGILGAVLNNKFDFRRRYVGEFEERFKDYEFFRVIKAVRGTPNNHKFVLLAGSRDIAEALSAHLSAHKIFSLKGYRLLTSDVAYLPNAKKIEGRVVEISIEDDTAKMEYLFEIISKFRG